MQRLKTEPKSVASMDELLTIAAHMEREAIDGYLALAQRMRAENRLDLVAVFEKLIAEEQKHLGQVEEWSGTLPERKASVSEPDIMFDAEGADLVAPDSLSAYRAFSMAVRNEERAFIFWTYIAAHAPSDDIRRAAERMASEELGHITTLRRERRLAFHDMRRADSSLQGMDIASIENRFAVCLEAVSAQDIDGGAQITEFAGQARLREKYVRNFPFGREPLPRGLPTSAFERPISLCGILLDCYLDLVECEKGEEKREFAQNSASDLVRCLAVLRSVPPSL